MTRNWFLTHCGSKTSFLFLSNLFLPILLSGRQFPGNFLNKFAGLPLSLYLMANLRVYYF